MRLVVGMVCLGIVAVAAAADWPTFRGSDRLALSKDTGLLQSWPAEGPPLVWETKGAGRGYASLAVAGDRIYTLGDGLSTADDRDEYLTCFNREDGQPLWKTKTGPYYTNRNPSWESSRSTPTVDGDRVYVVTPFGKLVCCDSESGTEKWTKDLKAEFKGNKADSWGYSESPLVDGELVVVTPGGSENTLVALDKLTGELKWSAQRSGDRGAGHASVAISQIGDVKVYVQTTGSGPMGVRATDGEVLWTYGIDKTIAVAPTPIIRDDLVFFAAGYKRGGALLRQVAGENGNVSIEAVYPLETSLANKHGGIVLVGEHVYGDSDDAGIPFCAELMTGKIAWQKRIGGGSMSIAAADGCLYLHFADGKVILAKATPEGFEELGRFTAPHSGDRPSWSHPVVVDGRLYIREQDWILCYDVRAK